MPRPAGSKFGAGSMRGTSGWYSPVDKLLRLDHFIGIKILDTVCKESSVGLIVRPRLYFPALIIEFGSNGEVTVGHASGKSSFAPWSFRDGSIRLGGSIRVNEIDVVDPDG